MQEEERILGLIREVSNRLSIKMNRLYAPYGLTSVQFEILMELYLEDHVTMSTLAKRLNMSNSNLSAIISRMEQHHFVCRTRDQMDQRTVHVELCPQACEILGEIRETGCKDQSVFERISFRDRQDIVTGLEKLNEVLKECDSHE